MTSEILRVTNGNIYKFVGKVITDILGKAESKAEIIQHTLDSQGNGKNAVSIVPGVGSLIRNEKISAKERKTKNCLK